MKIIFMALVSLISLEAFGASPHTIVDINVDCGEEDGLAPFVSGAQEDKLHWDRLFFLASITNDLYVNPFNPEQQQLFNKELAKKQHIRNYLYGSITLAVVAASLGYLAFIGVGSPHLSEILVPAILPTAEILAELILFYGVAYEPHLAPIFDALILTFHDVALEELKFLALFLIRKSFSDDPLDIKRIKEIVATFDINAVRDAYARQGNATSEEVGVLTRHLEEALIYLKTGQIIDKSFEVGEEIRICLLELRQKIMLKKLCALEKDLRQP